MEPLYTVGSCLVFCGLGVQVADQFWSIAGRLAQCCGSYARFFNKKKPKLDVDTTTVGKFSSKLNYHV